MMASPSATFGCSYSTLSTSAGYTFSPPVMTMSLTRSTDEEEAFVVEIAEVAGVEPAASASMAAAVARAVPVTLHELRPRAQISPRALRLGQRLAVKVEHADLVSSSAAMPAEPSLA